MNKETTRQEGDSEPEGDMFSDPFYFWNHHYENDGDGNSAKDFSLTLSQYRCLIEMAKEWEERILIPTAEEDYNKNNNKEGSTLRSSSFDAWAAPDSGEVPSGMCVHGETFYQDYLRRTSSTLRSSGSKTLPLLFTKEEEREKRKTMRYHLYCCTCIVEGQERRDVHETETKDNVMAPVEVVDCTVASAHHHHQHPPPPPTEESADVVVYFNKEEEEKAAKEIADGALTDTHSCFLLAAGVAAAPTLLLYCFTCHRFSPLTEFKREVKRECGDGGATTEEEVVVSVEGRDIIIARLLLAFQFEYDWSNIQATVKESGKEEQEEEKSVMDREKEGFYLFLYQSLLFPNNGAETDSNDNSNNNNNDDEDTNLLEEDVEETFMKGILPCAAVVVPKGDENPPTEGTPPLLLLGEEALLIQPFLSTSSYSPAATPPTPSAPPNREIKEEEENTSLHIEEDVLVHHCVYGFVMQFPHNPSLLHKKLSLLARHRYRLTQRWVFLEDVQRWVLAHVPHHVEYVAASTTQEKARCYVRTTAELGQTDQYTFPLPLPPSLWQQYFRSVTPSKEVSPSFNGAPSPVELEAQMQLWLDRFLWIAQFMRGVLEADRRREERGKKNTKE